MQPKQSLSRRKFLGLAAGTVAGATLAACVPAGAPPAATSQPEAGAAAPAAEGLSLRMGWWGGLSRNELYNQICDLYEQQNEGITIVREYAAWADYWTKVATQAAGGNLPDITASVIDTLSEYALRGAYAPMDPFIETADIAVDDWDPMVLNSGKVNDTVYMMPTGVTLNCIIMNQDIIKRAGLEPLPFEITFAEFADATRALQGALPEDTWATTNGGGYSEHFQSWILQKGYQIANEDATDVGFPREVAEEFFAYWDGLYDEGVVIPIEISSQPLGDTWADSFLAKGQVAMMYINSNQLKIYQQYTEDDLIIVRNPMMPDGAHRSGEYQRPSALSIAANSQNQQATAKFINFFVNDVEATRIFNLELGAVGPKHVQDALRDTVNPKDVLVLDHFNACLKDIPPKMPDPKGTAAVLAAHRRAAEAISYGTSIGEALDTFFAEAKDAYAVNQS
jgi:multiple sugar transport system substrate-binding protein